ncbi:MAG: hypothetical protein DRQ55_06085 [Planctomycetota bacterium]|nr:MAG: hypothetical protein DRQ55_06085 [Planctomycetota bacterium]
MRTALLMLLLCALPACVSMQRGGLYPQGRDRVFLGYFDNKTFYRDVQFLLTEQVAREINKRPGLKLAPKDQAAVLLTGEVLSVRQQVLSEDPSQAITSSSTTITVKIEIHDAYTGELIKTATLTQQGQFVPSLGEDLESAQRQAYRFLARDIVRQLEAEF